jgi:hypothetical protein
VKSLAPLFFVVVGAGNAECYTVPEVYRVDLLLLKFRGKPGAHPERNFGLVSLSGARLRDPRCLGGAQAPNRGASGARATRQVTCGKSV